MLLAIAEDAEANGLHPVGPHDRGHERDLHFLAGGERAVRECAAGRIRHCPDLPGLGAQARQHARQRIAPLGLDHLDFAAFDVFDGVLGLVNRLAEYGRVGRGQLGPSLRRPFGQQLAGRERILPLRAGSGFSGLLFRPLRAHHELGDLLGRELLAVLARQHAAQQLDDLHTRRIVVLGGRPPPPGRCWRKA